MTTVSVSVTASTIKLDPDPVVAQKGTRPTIVWAIGSERGNKVKEITAIHIEDWDRAPGAPRQPAPVPESSSWQVFNPNGEVRSYKYTVTVLLDDGTTETIDPNVNNQGQGP